MDANVSQTPIVYVGTYTNTGSEGIYAYRFDRATGALEFTGNTAKVGNPSFLVVGPGGRRLYSVNEGGQVNGKPAGGVSAFDVDPQTGALALLNQETSAGAGPCYISLDKPGKHALVANYGSGSVAVLPIGADGRLGPPSDVAQHEGKGPNPKRQERPHAHCVMTDPAGRFVFAVDLGVDKVFVYRLDEATGKLAPNDPPFAEMPPGAGPRHIAFHPDGRHAYVINELDSSLTACDYDPDRGVLTPRQTLSTLPEGFTGRTHCAEVVVHPNGRFVYGSNRGHDSIAIFAVGASGELTTIGWEPSGGKEPRNFVIDPTGMFLLAANQNSDNIVVFRIDPTTGKLTPTGSQVSVPRPVCIRFAP